VSGSSERAFVRTLDQTSSAAASCATDPITYSTRPFHTGG
jgi:hypothetical protein